MRPLGAAGEGVAAQEHSNVVCGLVGQPVRADVPRLVAAGWEGETLPKRARHPWFV